MSKHKMIIRSIRDDEIDLLEEFLYQAVFVPPGHGPIFRDVVNVPEVRAYIEDFGKPDDCCLVAERNGGIVGAVWSRILVHPGKNGYGNIDEHTPELAISVLPEYRNQGIGAKLLDKLFMMLTSQGYSRLSLSVQKGNLFSMVDLTI